MQVVGVGFIIGVLQDSCETALNSSSDVLFTATAEYTRKRKEGKDFVINTKKAIQKEINLLCFNDKIPLYISKFW